jgi:hypothetical protein
MVAVLIHWRIKPDKASYAAFVDHWQTKNAIGNRQGLMAEFLSGTLPMASFPYITWHLDEAFLGDFKSSVTIGIWADAKDFKKQIAKYFTDARFREVSSPESHFPTHGMADWTKAIAKEAFERVSDASLEHFYC